MKRDANGFILPDNDDIDPAVRATISVGNRRQDESRMSKKDRDRKRKQRQKNQAAAPRRMDLLIDPDAKAWVVQQAADLQCSQSDVVEFAIRYLQSAVEDGAFNLSRYAKPLQNPRYRQKLIYPTD